jgi:hypothetical protein
MADSALRYAFEILSMSPEERLNIIDLTSARKAMKRLATESRLALKAISDPAFKTKWHLAEKSRSEARAKRNQERTKDELDRQAYFQSPEGKAELKAQKKLKAELPKEPGKRAVKIAQALDDSKTLKSFFDTVKISGRAIGDVHYRELHQLRQEGLFEGALCDQILRHARPNTNVTIRQIMNEETLTRYVAVAKEAVKRVEREGVDNIFGTKKWSWQVHA